MSNIDANAGRHAANDEPLALTIRQFCSRVGISRSSLYAYSKAGKIRIVSIGGRSLVPMTEVQRLLNGERS